MEPNTCGRSSRALRGLVVTLAVVLVATTGCVHLYHMQIGDLDSSAGKLRAFEVMVSDTGINIKEASQVGGLVAPSQKGNMHAVQSIMALFQTGPSTGNPGLADDYADGLSKLILEKCPSGRVTGITAIREQEKYPIISGEIVRITAYCID